MTGRTNTLRIVRRLAVFLLIAAPLAAVVGMTEAGAISATTVTAETAIPATPQVYGSEAGTVTATVTGQVLNGNPLGVVTFTWVDSASATETICSASTANATGASFTAAGVTTFTCNIPSGTTLDVGTSVVTATYVPASPSSSSNGISYSGSNGASGATLTITPEAVTPTISLAVAPTTVDFGNEQVAVFTATVSSPGEGSDNNAATLTQTVGVGGACALGAASGGVSTCSPTASQYAAGTTNSFTASVAAGASTNPDFTFNAAGPSNTVTLTIHTLVGTTSSLTVVPGSVALGSESSVVFTDTVTGTPGDGTPIGTVTVTSGGVTLCTTSTVASNPTTYSSVFSCSTTNNSALPAGPGQSIVATYTPAAVSSSNALIDYETSAAPGTLTVTGAPAGPPGVVINQGTRLPAATHGRLYMELLTASGGATPAVYTDWTITAVGGGEEVPPGLHINPSTGLISGTAGAIGTYTFTVSVTDTTAPSETISQVYTLTIH